MKTKKVRTWWQDFILTDAFVELQGLLREKGYHLRLRFDDKKTCVDAYILKDTHEPE